MSSPPLVPGLPQAVVETIQHGILDKVSVSRLITYVFSISIIYCNKGRKAQPSRRRSSKQITTARQANATYYT